MNRRDFVKAVAGIPLLGLLVKMPEVEESPTWIIPGDPDYVGPGVGSEDGLNLIFPGDPGYIDTTLYEAAYAELQAGAEAQPPYELIADQEPFGTIYWVNEVSGDDANDGLSPETALATHGRASEQASGARGDFIFSVSHGRRKESESDSIA